MADETLSWQLKLIDSISSPAGSATKSLEQFNAQINVTNINMAKTDGAAKGASGGLGEMAQSMNAGFQMAIKLAEAFVALAERIAAAGLEFGKFVVNQAIFHQGTMTTFRTLLGGQGAARAEFGRSMQLAALLPGSTQEFTQQRRGLVQNGFTSNRERDFVFALQQDIAAMQPENTQAPEQISRLLGQIRGTNSLDGHILRELMTVGIGRGPLFDAIAAGRHLIGTRDSQRAQVAALMKSHQIHGNEAIRGIAGVDTSRTHERIGQFALDQGNSIAGQISNVLDAPSMMIQRALLQSGGFENMPGGHEFVAFLSSLNGLLSGNGERAQHLQRIFQQLIGGTFGAIFGHANAGNLFDALLSVLDRAVPAIIGIINSLRQVFGPAIVTFIHAMEPLARAFANMGHSQRAAHDLENLGKVLGLLAAAIVWVTVVFGVGLMTIISGVVDALDILNQGVAWFFSLFVNGGANVTLFFMDLYNRVTTFFTTLDIGALGTQLMQGLANGIAQGSALVWDAIQGVGTGVLDRVKSIFRIHSPSRVMADLGYNVSAGFGSGIDDGAGLVQSSLTGLLAQPTTSLRGLGATRSSAAGAQSIGDIAITIQIPDSRAQDGHSIGEEVKRVLPDAIMEVMERLAIEQGA